MKKFHPTNRKPEATVLRIAGCSDWLWFVLMAELPVGDTSLRVGPESATEVEDVQVFSPLTSVQNFIIGPGT